ncbi:hypothetical protein T01_5944 [Trichinella spiralis]|uniref:Uncharacterized protein n=1 Tax=Trichinella spiralis TaxID=6334 RepID=A0A0V1BWW0_TRISP|nr:hypothetical protein T01_5944 [Trichinella spiralis]
MHCFCSTPKTGFEPATYGFLNLIYSPPLYQLSYQRHHLQTIFCVHNKEFVLLNLLSVKTDTEKHLFPYRPALRYSTSDK